MFPPNTKNVFNAIDPISHRARRRLLASPISDSSLKLFEPIVRSKIILAVSKIQDELEDSGTSDILKWWLFMGTDIIGELSFGESFYMLESGKVQYNYFHQVS